MNLNLSRYICRAVGILLLLAAAMPARAGLPMVRNFPRSLYGAGAQNWAVAQDSLGRMYFGNRFGLLMFDSQSWRLWRLPNYSTVRAIYLDGPKERIYVGGSEDFGYFEADALTHLPVYRSLTPTISVPGTNFSEIWQIHRVGSDLWFQSDFKMMRYDGRQTDVVALSDKITTSAVVGNRLMAGLMHGGLVEVTQRRSVDITGAAELKGKRIVAILPARQGGRRHRYSLRRTLPPRHLRPSHADRQPRQPLPDRQPGLLRRLRRRQRNVCLRNGGQRRCHNVVARRAAHIY